MAAEIVSAVFSGGQVALHTLSLASPSSSHQDRLKAVRATIALKLKHLLGQYSRYLTDLQYETENKKLDDLLGLLANVQASHQEKNIFERTWNYSSMERDVAKIEAACENLSLEFAVTTTEAKKNVERLMNLNYALMAGIVDGPKETTEPQTPTTQEDSSEAISTAPSSSCSQDPLGVGDVPATTSTRTSFFSSAKKTASPARRPTEDFELQELSD